ncbi:YtpR family tRNA-binding protein [Fervidibacillus halotolerans]|uniref:DUF4479 domain-containing protein n=1 Tax=Fervidibacillus halotolerans TaxID=2980027 RepID=A0A9E8RZL0_9BACI|nr:DUF4479 domain-containing protein [Fervidibacillus halotolerans]WAA11747.1 DUF4479 domain-containing protein [Fervidibacillus halotolerans]
MNLFYNKEGIGDTLIVSLTPIDRTRMEVEKKEDVVRIYDRETNKTFGYNIFQASTYFSLEGYSGPVNGNEQLLNELNQLLKDQGFQEQLTADFSPKFVVGYVKGHEKHPKADKLSVCHVDVGEETLQIVCGAPNVAKGQKVVVAKVGAVMPDGLVISPAELRGVPSKGMICSAKELNLPNAPKEKGILVLDDRYEVGQPFDFQA